MTEAYPVPGGLGRRSIRRAGFLDKVGAEMQ